MTARQRPPRYARIASSLKERIESGEIGAELPSLDKLRTEYSCGRATMGRSIAILVQEGVVKRRIGYTYAAARAEGPRPS
jgi:DNA-binding GntR family transcriptional regulator